MIRLTPARRRRAATWLTRAAVALAGVAWLAAGADAWPVLAVSLAGAGACAVGATAALSYTTTRTAGRRTRPPRIRM